MYGQETLSFRHIDSRQGLSQNSVLAIAQDGDGFMWFGTRNGLNRFDGYRIQHYEEESGIDSLQGLAQEDITSIYYDSAIDKLWICTNQGLSQYRKERDDFRSFPFVDRDGKSRDHVVSRCLLRDKKGILWLGSNHGVYRFEEDKQVFMACQRPDGLTGYFDIRAIYEDQKGRIWIGTNKGLYTFQANDDLHVRYAPRPSDPNLTDMFHSYIRLIAQDPEGRLWFGVRKSGMYSWKEGEDPHLHQHDPNNALSLNHNDVRAIGIGPQGRVWIGTLLGLNIYDPNKKAFLRYEHQEGKRKSLGSGSVRSIFFDTRGSAWIGTYYSGISYWNPDSYRFAFHQPNGSAEGLSHAVVSSFLEDETGNLWIGTEGGGINYWDRSRGLFHHYQHVPGQQNGLSGNNVKVIHGRGDSLWIGTFATGLNLFHLGSQRWEHFNDSDLDKPALTNNNVYDLIEKKGHLWIATYGGGLNVMNLTSGEMSSYQHRSGDSTSLISDLTRVIILDRDKHFWVGTSKGLDRLDTQGDKSTFVHVLKDVIVCCLLEASDGRIWLGSYKKGIYVLEKDGTIRHHIRKNDGLPGYTAFGLLEDEERNIWVSTEKGIAKINARDLSMSQYNHADGLDHLEYIFNAYYKSTSGEMFFGGTQGFTSFFSENIRPNTFIPPIVFSSLSYANERVRPGAENGLLSQSLNETEVLQFLYNKANFSIRFAALDFLTPENNQYAYKLEGLDEEWRYTKGETEVNYQIQKWGDYTFRLKGGNNDGLWNPEERTLTITVLPPPWLSPLAYLLYAVLLLLIILGIGRFIHMRQRLHLEKLTKEKQTELHEAKLRFYTNITHELRTPLTLILGPIEELLKHDKVQGEGKLKTVQKNAQRLLKLVNQLLTFRSLQQDQQEMEVAPGNIVKFLREIYLSFQDQARIENKQFEFIAEEEVIELWYDRDKLEKVLFNLLSNAFKFTPSGGNIRLRISHTEQEVQIQVCDSGPGIADHIKDAIFDRYYHQAPDPDTAQASTGIGLALSKQLVEMHGGYIEIENLPSRGACFRVHLKKGKAHIKPEELIEDFRDSEQIDAYLLKAAQDQQEVTPLEHPETDAQQETQTLLIVEDNAELRSYIQRIFAPFYHVILAENGKEGLATAQSLFPDLIISDVMMPEMDGISMCSQLKSKIETSHIPIILLTARTGQIFRVQGYETGADAYLTKPFSPYELSLTVRNLLETRRQIRNRFQTVLKLEPKEITITSSDEIFLTKAIDIVESHIGDAAFSVETFARELAISRPLLFTKIKAITNQTPNNFLKLFRLKRSAQLLLDSDIGVAEIAYQVGFRDARYFSKCFQKEFGRTPSEYRLQEQSISS